jgi:hypothetical protein
MVITPNDVIDVTVRDVLDNIYSDDDTPLSLSLNVKLTVAEPVKSFAAVMVTDDVKLPLLTVEPNDMVDDAGGENVMAESGNDENVTVIIPFDDVGNAGIDIGMVI